MVQLRKQEPVTVYQVLDGAGRPIGEVVQPAGEPVIGRGASTVLLVRQAPMGTRAISTAGATTIPTPGTGSRSRSSAPAATGIITRFLADLADRVATWTSGSWGTNPSRIPRRPATSS